MRQATLGWAGALLVAAGTAAEERPGLVRDWVDAAGVEFSPLPPLARDRMVEELDLLLAPGGVSLAWTWTGTRREIQPDQLLVVFLDSEGRGAHAGRPPTRTAKGCSSRRPSLDLRHPLTERKWSSAPSGARSRAGVVVRRPGGDPADRSGQARDVRRADPCTS